MHESEMAAVSSDGVFYFGLMAIRGEVHYIINICVLPNRNDEMLNFSFKWFSCVVFIACDRDGVKKNEENNPNNILMIAIAFTVRINRAAHTPYLSVFFSLLIRFKCR